MGGIGLSAMGRPFDPRAERDPRGTVRALRRAGTKREARAVRPSVARVRSGHTHLGLLEAMVRVAVARDCAASQFDPTRAWTL